MRRFTGKYADDGKERRLEVRRAAGHRCVRCKHPFESGKHGRGEWSPCDSQCTHGGNIAESFPNHRAYCDSRDVAGKLVDSGKSIDAKWRILTVHHFDGNKANDQWWNTLALCQVCHLEVQGKVDPEIPFFFEHSEWVKPFVAGFYAHKYEGRDITREEAIERLDELLAYELATV